MGIRSLLTSAAIVAGAAAQFATYTDDGHSIAVNVPSNTASTKSGEIYFQITAPSGTRWAAFGQGTGMTGSQMFIIYSSGGGNVTLSTRKGAGFRQPLHDASIQATLLGGSGVADDGTMVANVRCDSCLTWSGGSMDPTSSTSNWVYAYQTGSAIDDEDVSATITKHSSRGEFTLDLTSGTGGSTNPFAPAAETTSTGGSNTATSSTGQPTSTGTNNVSNPVISSGATAPNSGSSSPDSDNKTIYNNPLSHGVLMSVLFLALFPLASLTLFLPFTERVPYIHGPLQAVNTILLIVGMALGIVYGRQVELLDEYHQIIGYIVVATLVLVQPALGIYQHLNFRKTGTRSAVGVGHQWLGRGVMALGIINGGLGWMLTETTMAYVPYAVVAAVVFVLYAAVVVFSSFRQRRLSRSPRDKEAIRPESHGS